MFDKVIIALFTLTVTLLSVSTLLLVIFQIMGVNS
jgi:hypothetical protein